MRHKLCTFVVLTVVLVILTVSTFGCSSLQLQGLKRQVYFASSDITLYLQFLTMLCAILLEV